MLLYLLLGYKLSPLYRIQIVPSIQRSRKRTLENSNPRNTDQGKLFCSIEVVLTALQKSSIKSYTINSHQPVPLWDPFGFEIKS